MVLPATGRAVQVDMELTGDGMLECVPEEFNQVISNLVQNAIEAAPDPGGLVRLSTQHNDAFVTIAVRDNGRGIEPAILPYIFDLFTRGAGDRSGFGVGLSVARRLVELHHGRLEARSNGPGTGSEFVITLPTMAAD